MSTPQVAPIDWNHKPLSEPWKLTDAQTLGLALSGGGFRASLFHIGVLARLAELDLLRTRPCCRPSPAAPSSAPIIT